MADQLLNAAPWLVQGGAVGLLFWVARLVYIGSLVPRATLDRAERSAGEWREAYFAEVERNKELTAQVSRFLTAVREVAT